MELVIHPPGLAHWHGRQYRCALGRSGIVTNKREGDGGTPAGRFHLTGLLYRTDRVAAPVSPLPVVAVADCDGWCDDPDDPRYNEWVRLPYPARCESLWRDDRLYDVVAFSTYNTDPVIEGAGSAIFVHVAARDYAPTEGCIAFDLNDLITILGDFGPRDAVVVPASDG